MTYLDRAIKDGYAIITGPENKQKIIYVTSDNHTENYNDPEEKVRAEFWAELIYEYDYPAHRIKVEVTIPDRVPTDRADIVIFSDDECKKPYAVVECKRDGVTDAEFLQAIEQGVGNATWVKLRASYVVIIAGATRRVLDFSDDSTGILERENNIIADLPKAYGKPQAFRFYRGGEYTDVDGKKKKAPDIQPVAREDLITAIKKCHNTLWGGGRLSPPTAFGELCKLIFVKISDEQKPRKKGEPYQFQIKTHEPSSKLAERINALYNEQKVKDPEVFTDSIKVDDRVLRTVVSHLESINLNKTDLDVKGVAFEQFMDGFFKGDFGQYFTPRPIIEFAVKMMKPEHDWDVLDPACGSGGFLLHALDYMRSQASEYYDKDTVDYFNYWHDFASKHLYGIEINDEIARVAKMNMIVHDDGHTNVISFDALDSIDKMHDHRVDGNHRLLAIEKLIAEGQMRSNYLIPFCIIVFPDNVSMKDEKIIFHNINSKAVPIRSERLLEGIIVDSKDELSFSDKELDDSFGHEYLLARKVLKNKPLAIRKLKAIPWIRSDLITALIDIIESIQKRFGNIQTAEHEEAFGIALSNALNDAKLGENGTLLISSGLLFLLVALYYNIEISSPSADAVQYKDRLLTWSEKYQITDAQIDTEQNAASNAECIEAIFNRYVRSTEQTIFMSRCFSAEYNETENAIRRAINEINNEKKTGIMLIRVDEHHEGTTGQISDRIFRDIESAGLVIADLSSGKLNVPHEIGYAMGLKKDLILVHNGTSEEAEKHIPSNIRMFEQIRFNGDYQTLQNEIKRRLIDYYKL